MKCIVCKASEKTPKYPGLNIFRCNSCGHIYFNAETDSFNPKKIYTKDYFENGEYGNYLADAPVLKKNFSARLKHILNFCSGGRLLEIGSAYGLFLDMARRNFDVTGFEICSEAVSYARRTLNLDIKTNDFLKYSPPQPFDVVCLFDTIEHLLRPDHYIEKISNILKPGGRLFISTGDINSLVARIRGEHWRLIHPPSHIHYFSFDTISRLLRNNGFEIIDVKRPAVWRSFHQAAALILGIKFIKKMPPMGFILNLYDIMLITASKN